MTKDSAIETKQEKTKAKAKEKKPGVFSKIKRYFKDLRGEFKKIVWPDKMTVAKETAAVVSVSVVLGAIIALVDFFAQYGVDLLIK